MSVHDAEPMDIYADAQGKLWRCVGICREPTVIFEEVEGHTPDPVPAYLMNQSALTNANATPPRVPIIKDRQSGGVTGIMWEGFKRIWRVEPHQQREG